VFSRSLVAVVLMSGVLSAQVGIRETPLPEIGRPLTPFEQFTNQLRLDAKAQLPAVTEIMGGAERQAAPVAKEMQQLRIQLVNAERDNNAADIKAALDGYMVAASKMAAIEADAFTKVYALLKPNQQSRAPEAFAIMAGIFVPPAPPAPRPGQRGRGGQ
jgi:hypothetical protein